MSMKKLPLLAATALLAGLVTACTSFAPVYGDRSATSAQAVRFNFAAPDSRMEQIIFDRLKLAFPGQAGPDDPVLDLVATTDHPPRSISNAYPVARPINVRGQATVTITKGKEVLFEATRFADSAYQSGKLTPTDMASAQGAQENVAEGVAESLRAAILAGYRPTP
jgi:hypothetical protein